MTYLLIDAFGAYIEYFALAVFLWIFFEKNPQRTVSRRICHIIMPILFLLFSRTVENIYLRPLLFILCSIILALFYSGPLLSRIFSVVLFQITLILLEISFSFLVYSIKSISYFGFYLLANIITKTVTLLILWFLLLCSRKRKLIFSRLPGRDILLLLLFPVISLLFVSFSEYLIFLLDQQFFYYWGCLLIFCCIMLNIAIYYLFLRLSSGETAKETLKFVSYQLSQQKDTQDYLHHAYKKVRTMSHDMNRYLSLVHQLLQQGQVEEAMQSLKQHQLEIADTNLFRTGYPLLDSVMDYKYQTARSQGISMQVFWNIIDRITVDISDLAIILSNALDNAIEACPKKVDSPFIVLHAEISNGILHIDISNPTTIIPEIINNRIVTTKPDSESHGYGMESMHMLAEKYSGRIIPEYREGLFILHILLQNNLPVAN